MRYVFYRSGNPILDLILTLASVVIMVGIIAFVLPFLLSFVGIVIVIVCALIAWSWAKVKFFGAQKPSNPWENMTQGGASNTIFRETIYRRKTTEGNQTTSVTQSWKNEAEDAEVVKKHNED